MLASSRLSSPVGITINLVLLIGVSAVIFILISGAWNS